MTLSMSRPFRHPKTGVYELRRRVPDDLRALIGKREEKRTLGTRDPNEAKKRHLEALAELEARWANLRRGPRRLSELEAHEYAKPVHDWWLRAHRENPSEQRWWNAALAEKLFPWFRDPEDPNLWSINDTRAHMDLFGGPDGYELRKMQQWCEAQADEVLAHYGLQVDVGRGMACKVS